jgi:2-oxoisovalerate dehydrogenase E1 component alpha subunit
MDKEVAGFHVRYLQVLNEHGQLTADLPASARDTDTLLTLYRSMVRTRAFDQKAVVLQRTGSLGTYPSCLGQEAVGTAMGLAMSPEDVLLPTYRDCAAQFQRGVRMLEILLYWGGDERGMDFQVPKRDFPICVPIASHCCHAVGVAMAMAMRREARVAVCMLGDGATSKGDFYEAINAAGVWRLPVIFLVTNNQWAISVPRSQQSAAQTLAQKAVAAGIDGIQVDGNDPIAVWDVALTSLAKARNREGPILIEALSYRMADHTTADDAKRYRSTVEVEQHAQLDPVKRLRIYLTSIGVWSDAQEAILQRDARQAVELAVQEYQAMEPLAEQSVFDHVYECYPSAYEPQRESLIATTSTVTAATEREVRHVKSM